MAVKTFSMQIAKEGQQEINMSAIARWNLSKHINALNFI